MGEENKTLHTGLETNSVNPIKLSVCHGLLWVFRNVTKPECGQYDKRRQKHPTAGRRRAHSIDFSRKPSTAFPFLEPCRSLKAKQLTGKNVTDGKKPAQPGREVCKGLSAQKSGVSPN